MNNPYGRRPDVRDALICLSAVAVAIFCIALFRDLLSVTTLIFLSQIVGFALPAMLLVRVKSYDAEQSLSLRGIGAGRVVAVVIVALAGMVVLLGIVGLQEIVFRKAGIDLSDEVQRMDRSISEIGSGGLWLLILTVVVAPALCEELLFRGILLSGLARSFGKTRGVLYSALLFAAMHMSIVKLVPTLLLGILFGYLVIKTGSILSSMVAHLVNNLSVIAIGSMERFKGETMDGPPLFAAGAAIVVLVLGLTYLSLNRFDEA